VPAVQAAPRSSQVGPESFLSLGQPVTKVSASSAQAERIRLEFMTPPTGPGWTVR
jgi:hypothetical protein